ncbi:MAG: hypothetical protein VW362_04575 [Candidatus Nanopelagicales bacterium]
MPRASGKLHPTDNVPVPPSTVITFLMTGGSSAQASPWYDDTGTAAATAKAAGVHLVRVTPVTTAGGVFSCNLNLMSTAATVPTSGVTISTTSRSLVLAPREFQVPGGSTGFSVACPTSGNVIVECWRK